MREARASLNVRVIVLLAENERTEQQLRELGNDKPY